MTQDQGVQGPAERPAWAVREALLSDTKDEFVFRIAVE